MNGLDAFIVGEKLDYGTHTFTPEEIVRFARKYDPQPFHVDAEAARHSMFGALCASGWHTASVWMKLAVNHRPIWFQSLRERGLPVPYFGPSPGIFDVAWLKPVYAGDTIHYHSECIEKRPRKTDPDWGIVITRASGFNEAGDKVISFDNAVLIRKQPSDQSPS